VLIDRYSYSSVNIEIIRLILGILGCLVFVQFLPETFYYAIHSYWWRWKITADCWRWLGSITATAAVYKHADTHARLGHHICLSVHPRALTRQRSDDYNAWQWIGRRPVYFAISNGYLWAYTWFPPTVCQSFLQKLRWNSWTSGGVRTDGQQRLLPCYSYTCSAQSRVTILPLTRPNTNRTAENAENAGPENAGPTNEGPLNVAIRIKQTRKATMLPVHSLNTAERPAWNMYKVYTSRNRICSFFSANNCCTDPSTTVDYVSIRRLLQSCLLVRSVVIVRNSRGMKVVLISARSSIFWSCVLSWPVQGHRSVVGVDSNSRWIEQLSDTDLSK